MTDNQEDTMKVLNTARLHEVIGSEQNQAESQEIEVHTRNQQRLLADTERAEELDAQIAKDEDYARRLTAQIADMQKLLDQCNLNVSSARIERQSCLASQHSLRVAGVSLP
jgi:hypothetical protein